MLHRLLFLAVIVGFLALAVWDIVRRNPGLFTTSARKPKKRPPLVPIPSPAPAADPGSAAPSAGGRVLAFLRPPHDVLGIDKGADLAVAEQAYARLRAEYAPERLADMSDELRELAERRTRELDRAIETLRARHP